VIPFACIWCGKAELALRRGTKISRGAVLALFSWAILSRIWLFSTTYLISRVRWRPFKRALVPQGSSTDWGQDLYYLREWGDARPAVKPIKLFSSGVCNPSPFGVVHEPACLATNSDDNCLGLVNVMTVAGRVAVPGGQGSVSIAERGQGSVDIELTEGGGAC
jgi:hypothetical protein